MKCEVCGRPIFGNSPHSCGPTPEEKKQIINLTPHRVVFRAPWGEVVFESHGMSARVDTRTMEALPLYGMSAIFRDKGDVYIPVAPLDGSKFSYIVSSMVLDAIDERCPEGFDKEQFVAPDTGKTAVRDENGRIVAVTRWVRID
jgi:hypothetical protein